MMDVQPDNHGNIKTEPIVTTSIFISNLVVPGLGLCLNKQILRGLIFEFVWMLVLGLLVWGMAFYKLHPVKAVIIAAISYCVIQLDLLFQYTKRKDARLSLLTYLAGLLFFIVSLDAMLAFGFKPNLGLSLVTDMGEFPALFPGDIVLYRKTKKKIPAIGRLFVIRPAKNTSIQRLVGKTDDIIEVNGPQLKVNGQVWKQKDMGIAKASVLKLPASIQAFQETVPDTQKHHLVFFSSTVEQAKLRKKVASGMFFLADNRSTDNVKDSRIIGPLPQKAIIGRPLLVILSLSATGGVNFRRSGIRVGE